MRVPLLASVSLLLASCAIAPRVPPALVARGEPLPFDIGPFSHRDGTTLYGYELAEHSFGAGGRLGAHGPEMAGASRFVITQGGATAWEVVCPARATTQEAPGADLVCLMSPRGDRPAMVAVLTGDLYGRLQGVFVESASVAYDLAGTSAVDSAFSNAITAGFSVRRPGRSEHVAFVSAAPQARPGGFVASDVPDAERSRLAPMLLTLTGAADIRTQSATYPPRAAPAPPRTAWIEPAQIESAPPPWRPALRALVAADRGLEARVLLDTFELEDVEGLFAAAPVVGPDLRGGVDRWQIMLDMLSFGVVLPNGNHQGFGGLYWLALGVSVFDLLQAYGVFEVPGTSAVGPRPIGPIGPNGDSERTRGVRLGGGLRLVALRLGPVGVLPGVELSAGSSTERVTSSAFGGGFRVALARAGTTVSPTLALRYLLGTSGTGDGVALLVEGRAEYTRWKAGSARVEAADGAITQAVATELATAWQAADEPFTTWSGSLRFSLRIRF